MLKSLQIKNVALIENAEIDFAGGLNVLTGETGAGKSIVLEALNFVLGQKADKTLILHGENECRVTAFFDISNNFEAKQALSELDIEADDELIIKRVFTSDGKGSIKLNGEIVTAAMLRRVTAFLVDIHGQSDHYILLKESAQKELIDNLKKDEILPIKSEILDIITKLEQTQKELKFLGGDPLERVRRLEILDFSIKEIENADIKSGELDELVARRKILQNLEKIIRSAYLAEELLTGDGGVIDKGYLALKELNQISDYGENYYQLAEKLSGALEEIKEVSLSVTDGLDGEFNEDEADLIEKRLDLIKKLNAKYGGGYNEVQASLENFKSEYNLLLDKGADAEALTAKKEKLNAKLLALYQRLSQARKDSGKILEKALTEKLRELAMKNAMFEVQVLPISNPPISQNGADEVTFMFSANKGEPLKPLGKIISGGELSRLMLALKSAVKEAGGSKAFVFDEIDTGISGRAASVVAENFAKIAAERQLIAVSHLPQIAAMADNSLYIEKIEEKGKTRTQVKTLTKAEKLLEVVRLAGGTTGEVGEKFAEELIERSDNFKKLLV